MEGLLIPAVKIDCLSAEGLNLAMQRFIRRYDSVPTVIRVPEAGQFASEDIRDLGLRAEISPGPPIVYCPSLLIWPDQLVTDDIPAVENQNGGPVASF